MEPIVRRVQIGDAPAWKAIRLRALLDTPSAFGRTHAEEVEYPDELWEARIELGSSSSTAASFMGLDTDGEPVGMVAAFIPEGATIPDLVSMWVAPEQRGTPLATNLVESVIGWVGDEGFNSVELWVTRGNDRAQAFYERMGFVVTGEVAPLPSDPCKDEIRMRRVIADE